MLDSSSHLVCAEWLAMNANKSEVIILDTTAQLRSAAAVAAVDVAGTALPVSSQLKSLGVIIDMSCTLTATSELSSGRATTTFVPCDTCVNMTTETAQTVACSVISSRIDYCNSLLYGAPVTVVEKLQRSQNNVARVICQQRRCVHARPLLKTLHWLPVQQRIQYKIAVITHKALSTSVPPYTSTNSYNAK